MANMRMILRVLLNALALYIADYFLDGIVLSGVLPAFVGGLVLGVINAIIRPVLIVLTFPVTLITLGLFIFVVNAVCFGLAAALVPGFHVAGFWSALGGALIVSVVSWILSGAVKDRHGDRRVVSSGRL
jgi:putative membrane protein